MPDDPPGPSRRGSSMLADHDPSWSVQFAEAAADLRRWGRVDWVIEHIGSTAIPGLAAKPIIDLAVRLADAADFERHRSGLESGGWRVGSGVRTHPVMVLEPDGQRTHVAHFFLRSDWSTVNQRILRDWLLGHPDDARWYETAKRDAEVRAAAGGTSYNAAKTAAVQAIVDRARTELGLPLVPVSDK